MVKTKRERIEVIMREKLAKYEQIRQDIIHKIESMEYRPNQVIPSENELCASYGRLCAGAGLFLLWKTA